MKYLRGPQLLALAALAALAPALVAQPAPTLSVEPAYFTPAVGLRAAAPPPLRLADRPGMTPRAELRPAVEAAADQLEAIAVWNRGGRLPVQNGFTRSLGLAERVTFAPDLAAKLAGPTAMAAHAGGLLARSAAGNPVWGTEVVVTGAWRTRLGLSEVDLPAGSRLWVYGEGGRSVGPFGLELLREDGTLWTPSIEGERIRLEVEIPAGRVTAKTGFLISDVAELFRLDRDGRPGTGVSLDPRGPDTSCLVDAQCVGAGTFDVIDLAQQAIAYIEFVDGNLTFICSGGLLNDTDTSTVTPYFLTANHCLSTQASAASLEAFWDYYTDSCNGVVPNLNDLDRSNGSTLLTTGAVPLSDYTLLQLNSIPSNRVLLGWNANANATPNGTTFHRISHPFGFEQHYSRSQNDTSAPTCTGADRPTFLYHRNDMGGTFGGSSGAPIILAGGQTVGQLTGGCGTDPQNGCNSVDNAEVDGAFSASFGAVGPFLTGTATGCIPGPTTLCLNNGRFQVELEWANQLGASGDGMVAPAGSDDSGIFYFTNPDNWEMLIKVVNACIPAFDRFWVFYAATTNVEFTVTVTDTETNLVKQYFNPLGNAAPPVQDTQAFATCP